MLVFLLFFIFSPIAFAILAIFTLWIFKLVTNPKLNKNWIELHKNLPEIDVREEVTVYIRNIANARYNPFFEFEYTLNELNKKYNLNDLVRVWFFVNNYAPLQSHVMITFEFLGGIFLSVSPEVRKNSLGDFQVWHVLTKKYSIFYRFATEQDQVYLRTNIRNSPLKMFQLDLTNQQMRNLFLNISETANKMIKKDLIYKLFKTDCVHILLNDMRRSGIVVKKYPWDASPIKVLRRSNLIKGEITFLNNKTQNLKPDENFSIKIRMW